VLALIVAICAWLLGDLIVVRRRANVPQDDDELYYLGIGGPTSVATAKAVGAGLDHTLDALFGNRLLKSIHQMLCPTITSKYESEYESDPDNY